MFMPQSLVSKTDGFNDFFVKIPYIMIQARSVFSLIVVYLQYANCKSKRTIENTIIIL